MRHLKRWHILASHWLATLVVISDLLGSQCGCMGMHVDLHIRKAKLLECLHHGEFELHHKEIAFHFLVLIVS